jgi:hypothetical protein
MPGPGVTLRALHCRNPRGRLVGVSDKWPLAQHLPKRQSAHRTVIRCDLQITIFKCRSRLRPSQTMSHGFLSALCWAQRGTVFQESIRGFKVLPRNLIFDFFNIGSVAFSAENGKQRPRHACSRIRNCYLVARDTDGPIRSKKLQQL